MSQAATSLAHQFPPPAEADWLRQVEKVLKGASADTLIVRSPDGLEVRPLYTAADADAAPAAATRAPSVEKPGGWDLRVWVDNPSPALANADLLQDLKGGASSLLVSVDPTGRTGVALAGEGDLSRLLEGVMLDIAPVALDAGFAGPLAAQWLGAAAKRAPQAKLAFHLDPLGAFAAAGRSPGPLDGHIARAAGVAVQQAAIYPKASLFLANGRAVHEAGGTDVLELAVMAAAAAAYLRALTDAGLSSQQAFAGVVLGVSVDGDFTTGLTKVRAARLLWRQLTRACGLTLPARVEARSSRRMLTRLDPWTNLLRLTSATFAGAVGGADAVVLDPFTQALGAPNDVARRQARNIQLVAMEEARLGVVEDPARGAWALDARTIDLARAAWDAFVAIEGQGGLIAALGSGAVAEQTAAACAARQADYASGKAKILGVNLHRQAAEEPLDLPTRDAGDYARPVPDIDLDGPDNVCPPLQPVAWSAPLEAEA